MPTSFREVAESRLDGGAGEHFKDSSAYLMLTCRPLAWPNRLGEENTVWYGMADVPTLEYCSSLSEQEPRREVGYEQSSTLFWNSQERLVDIQHKAHSVVPPAHVKQFRLCWLYCEKNPLQSSLRTKRLKNPADWCLWCIPFDASRQSMSRHRSGCFCPRSLVIPLLLSASPDLDAYEPVSASRHLTFIIFFTSNW